MPLRLTISRPARLSHTGARRNPLLRSACGVSLGRRLGMLLAATSLCGTAAYAAPDTWTGAVDNQWETAGNWSAGLPTTSSDVTINSSNPFPFLAQSSPTISSLIIDGASSPYGGALVTNGKTLTVNSTMVIGVTAATGSQVLINGANSTLVVNGQTLITSPGGGWLILDHGANAQLNGGALLGLAAGHAGRLYVNNGSTLSGGDFYVGAASFGLMAVQSGSTASVSSISLGDQAGGQGTLVVDGNGSTVNVTGWGLTVGNNGAGTVTVQNGGVLNAAGGIVAGVFAGSSGTITVTGAGSQINGAGGIGGAGTGLLNVSNGGAYHASGTFFVGNGTVNVTGAGSSLTAGALGNVVFVGATATLSSLNVAAGGTADFTAADAVAFGPVAGAVGGFSVDGVGSQLLSQSMSIGKGGTGTASVTNGGTVTIGNSDTLSLGAMAGASGTLVVDGAGSHVSAGYIVVGDAGTGQLTVANGATVSASYLTLAGQAGSQGSLIIGAATGAPVAPGTLAVGVITGGAGLGGIQFNHTGNFDLTSTVATGNNFVLMQKAGVTRLSGDGSLFTGAGFVSGGSLIVDSNFGSGAFAVTSGGVLGGGGTVGLINATTGIVDPGAAGNTIGTLHVTGTASFGAASTYKVDVNAAGQSDLLSVGGATTLTGGTVAVMAASGNYSPSTKYTILTSAGGVTGTFAQTTSNFAFLTPSLSYDANHVYLTLTTGVSNPPNPPNPSNPAPPPNLFASAATTPNQLAASGGIASLGSGNVVFDALLVQSVTSAPIALNQLSGDAHASFATEVMAESPLVREAVNDRLRAAFESIGNANAMALAYADGDGTGRGAARPFATWFQAFGSFDGRLSDDNAGTERHRLGGGIGGIDGPILVGDQLWRIGLAGASSATSSKVDSRNAGATIDTASVTFYAGTQAGPWNVRLGASAAHHGFDTSRTVAFPGFIDRLAARYDARSYQLFGEASYMLKVAQLWLEPFAGAAAIGIDRDAFTETGAAAALTAQSKFSAAGYTSLGLRALQRFGAVSLDGSLAWRHGFGDVNTPTTLSFVSGGTPFTVTGVTSRDVAVVAAGVRTELSPTASAGISYRGQFGAHATDNGARADITVRF